METRKPAAASVPERHPGRDSTRSTRRPSKARFMFERIGHGAGRSSGTGSRNRVRSAAAAVSCWIWVETHAPQGRDGVVLPVPVSYGHPVPDGGPIQRRSGSRRSARSGRPCPTAAGQAHAAGRATDTKTAAPIAYFHDPADPDPAARGFGWTRMEVLRLRAGRPKSTTRCRPAAETPKPIAGRLRRISLNYVVLPCSSHYPSA